MHTPTTTSIVTYQPDVNLTTDQRHIRHYDLSWMKYMSIHHAITSFEDQTKSLRGARTKSRHTWLAYARGLFIFLRFGHQLATGQEITFPRVSIKEIDSFFDAIRQRPNDTFIAHPLPNADLLNKFIAAITATGTGPSTINHKYMAPVRKYLTALTAQEPNLRHFASIEDYMQFVEWRESIRRALEIRVKDTSRSEYSALWSYGVRLKPDQVTSLLRQIDRSTLAGLRNYALMLVAFSTGFRVAELTRITLSSILHEGTAILIKVEGKRGNMDPVPISAQVQQAIMDYVDAYNNRLEDHADPRRITDHTPLWCGILCNDQLPEASNPSAGSLATRSIGDIIKRLVKQILGITFSAHDTRRTCAYIAFKCSMSLENIRRLLRHANVGITAKYIGVEPDYSGSTLSNYITLG